jgi:C4-dicarboxylate transporter, DctQ subunit
MRRAAGFIDRFEENSIALLLATMTLVSFSQVIARYVFNSGWTGALELTRILFAWLILFGMSYGIKVGAHLGVDAFVRLLPKRLFRLTAIFAAVCTLLYALILLKSDWLRLLGIDAKGGAFDYWFRMFKLGIGLDDLRFPVWMQETFGLQERVHRWIAYLILPVGLVLLAFRTIEALVAILRGKRELIIAAHEGETLVGQSVVVADHPESRE